MRSERRIAHLVLLILPLLAGCSAGWQKINPTDPAAPAQVADAAVLEFHADSQLVRLHAVRFTRDSVSGVPWLEHARCDSCRVSYALAGVADMRVGDPGRPAWGLVLPLAALAAFLGFIGAACNGCMY